MEVRNEKDIDVDITEIKKVLEDANLLEPNMSKELMISYYKALSNSKNTASEEDQTRRLNQSQDELKTLLDDNEENIESTPVQSNEKPFIPKAWTSTKKLSLENSLEHNNNENLVEENIFEEIINDSPKDATKMAFGFNEMGKNSEHTLTIITHELKFIPIQSSNRFLNAGTALKARMLFAYHTKVNKMKTELARLSFYPAPIPKITSTTETFSSFSENNFPETYVCRSGRQTKRKIYNYDDDDDSLDGTSNKKVKNSEEEEWLSKSTQKNSIRSNKKQETNKTEISKTEADSVDTNKEKKVYPKKETRTPLSKKMSNADIMKRSSLFGETPKRRCEMMFENLKEEEERKEREEKNMELFSKTLETLDDENNENILSEEIITVDDEESVRIRVIPPIPGRKLMGRKRSNPEGLTPLDIKTNSQSQKKESTNGPSSSPNQEREQTKQNLKKRPAIRKTTVDSTNSLPSTSRTLKTSATNNVNCPICDRSFDESKIEEHAATCGDEPTTRSSSKMSRITCEICDKVVSFDTNYEVHVKECIAKKKDKD